MTSRSRARRSAGVLAIALTAGLLTGAATAEQARAQTVATAPTARTAPAATKRAVTNRAATNRAATNLAATVKAVAVVPTDFASGYQLVLIPGGDSTAGQITMEFCGFRFTAEAHRVARHQMLLLDATGRSTGLTNEVVAYDTVAQATKALTEWNRAVATCRRGVYVASKVPGYLPQRLDSATSGTLTTLPVATTAQTRYTYHLQGKPEQRYGIALLQRRGRVVTIVWYNTPVKPTATALNNVYAVARITGTRLARLAANRL